MSLGHPSYPRPKGTRNHSMAEKRGYVEIGETGPRKTRVAWSKLDRLNPNPDRGLSYSVVRPIGMVQKRPFSGNTRDLSADPDRSRVGAGLRESLVALLGLQFRENRVYPRSSSQ